MEWSSWWPEVIRDRGRNWRLCWKTRHPSFRDICVYRGDFRVRCFMRSDTSVSKVRRMCFGTRSNRFREVSAITIYANPTVPSSSVSTNGATICSVCAIAPGKDFAMVRQDILRDRFANWNFNQVLIIWQIFTFWQLNSIPTKLSIINFFNF